MHGGPQSERYSGQWLICGRALRNRKPFFFICQDLNAGEMERWRESIGKCVCMCLFHQCFRAVWIPLVPQWGDPSDSQTHQNLLSHLNLYPDPRLSSRAKMLQTLRHSCTLAVSGLCKPWCGSTCSHECTHTVYKKLRESGGREHSQMREQERESSRQKFSSNLVHTSNL